MTKEDYSKYYIQNSDHYLLPKDVFDELFNEMSNWKEENQELKIKLKMQSKYKVEIIEEDKPIIEKIKIEQDSPTHFYIRNEYGTKCGLTKHSKIIAEKLNEVIDCIIRKEDK